MFGTSVIELSESALRSNINFIRHTIGKRCKFSSVVKGNAYGHGIEEFVPLAEKCGVDHFSVFDAQEAYQVYQVTRQDTEIMIMGMVDPVALEWVIRKNISFFVFDLYRLEKAIQASKEIGIPARIHIELETGMNRTGLPRKHVKQAAKLINDHPEQIIVEGLCTHYAGAESIANYQRISRQYKYFKTLSERMQKLGVEFKTRHTACSAAALSYPKSRMNMARVGILQYGFWPSRETSIKHISSRKDKTDPLRRVITWKSQVMTIKEIKTGEFIGYGTTYMAERNMRVAVVPVGYSEGYSRTLSNQGRVLIKGHRVGVLGIVNMNMIIIDITNIDGVKPGDEIVLIGNQGELAVSVSSFGELSSQLNYELLTRLPRDIPRIRTA